MTFTPYNILTQIGEINAIPAKLIKSDGSTRFISIKGEEVEPEHVGGQELPGAIRVKSWSCNIEGLNRADFPDQGDKIQFFDPETKTERTYKTTRDAKTGRFWNWRYLKEGARIVFYTKYTSE